MFLWQTGKIVLVLDKEQVVQFKSQQQDFRKRARQKVSCSIPQVSATFNTRRLKR